VAGEAEGGAVAVAEAAAGVGARRTRPHGGTHSRPCLWPSTQQ